MVVFHDSTCDSICSSSSSSSCLNLHIIKLYYNGSDIFSNNQARQLRNTSGLGRLTLVLNSARSSPRSFTSDSDDALLLRLEDGFASEKGWKSVSHTIPAGGIVPLLKYARRTSAEHDEGIASEQC